MGKKILLVEDEELIIEILQEYLTLMDLKLELVVARNLKEAKERLVQERFDICICDCRLPDGLACELFEEGLFKSPVIITTGYLDPKRLEKAQRMVAAPVQVLFKPYQPKNLYDLLQMFLKGEAQAREEQD